MLNQINAIGDVLFIYASVAVVTVLIAFGIWQLFVKFSLKRNVKVTAYGTVRVTDIVIRSHRDVTGPSFFPDQLLQYIKRLTPLELAKISLDYSINPSEYQREIARAVTIASVLYKFYIPIKLARLDSRTKSLYLSLLPTLELMLVPTLDLTTVPVASEVKNNQGLTVPITYYVDQLTSVGGVILHFAAADGFPSLINFVQTFNNSQRKRLVFNEYEVRALLTAYAALTKCSIPKSYFESSPLAINILQAKLQPPLEAKPTKPRLALVKNDRQTDNFRRS